MRSSQLWWSPMHGFPSPSKIADTPNNLYLSLLQQWTTWRLAAFNGVSYCQLLVLYSTVLVKHLTSSFQTWVCNKHTFESIYSPQKIIPSQFNTVYQLLKSKRQCIFMVHADSGKGPKTDNNLSAFEPHDRWNVPLMNEKGPQDIHPNPCTLSAPWDSLS